MRWPSPHVTTARATRKASTIRRIVPLANPEYALAGGSVPVSTAAATAMTEAVRMGITSATTATIVAAKMAKRCHAGVVRPSGTGENQIARASATIAARPITTRRLDGTVVTATPSRDGIAP